MRQPLSILTVVLSSLFVAAGPGDEPIRGFNATSAKTQREWEARFQSIPDPARMRANMELLTSHPHHVGTAKGRSNAEWIRDQFASYGWEARIETFDVLFPTPVERVVELVAPTRFRAVLQESAFAEDPTTSQRAEQIPTFNAYSVDGDVTGPLVFVNYGVPADYEELERRGISVKGAIVIAKYGGSWRGIKPKVAAEHGAIGCLIYSDPRDDGYAAEAVYPAGPMRPPVGVQRGSVADMPVYPGDPLTPGVGATPDAKRLALKDAVTITKIPVLPISYADATPLLSALDGRVVAAWRGGLPITYRIGAGAARVHMRVKSDWSQKRLYNVIARLPGTTESDQLILRGNHHDAWVNGASDPISGLVAELEEARGLGEIYKQGWRPTRTIVYAAWDGEEPGLLGSTEWVETHATDLRQHAVAYVNTDGTGRGFLGVGGSHTLEKMLNGVAKNVNDPEVQASVWRRLQAQQIANGQADARTRSDLRISALGSGSDYSPFLQHLGIASLDMGYYGHDDDGFYHSIYDSFSSYLRFNDGTFVFGRALAQTAGTTVMRLAAADILPFAFTNLAETAAGYAKELQDLRDQRAKQIGDRLKDAADSVYILTRDPRNPIGPPKLETVPPRFEFAPVLNALDALTKAADAYEKAYAAWVERTATGRTGDPAGYQALNQQLLAAERALTSADGLPGRSWYQHLLYAPGLYTGYGVKTMPAAREAMEQGDWKNVNAELARIGAALQREADVATNAARALAAVK